MVSVIFIMKCEIGANEVRASARKKLFIVEIQNQETYGLFFSESRQRNIPPLNIFVFENKTRTTNEA